MVIRFSLQTFCNSLMFVNLFLSNRACLEAGGLSKGIIGALYLHSLSAKSQLSTFLLQWSKMAVSVGGSGPAPCVNSVPPTNSLNNSYLKWDGNEIGRKGILAK